jgi:hypothetical protein
MSRLVEFPLQDGKSSLLVQVDTGTSGPVTRGLGGRAVTEQAQQTFEEAVRKVQPAAQALVTSLRSLSEAPDEVAVEFGLQLSAEAGAFIASASTGANFKVSLTWHHLSPSTPGS